MAPFVQMIAGTANTVLGSVYSAKNDAGAVAITGTVLGNLSFVGAPLATKIMNKPPVTCRPWSNWSSMRWGTSAPPCVSPRQQACPTP